MVGPSKYMVPSRKMENLTSGMGWDGMWVAATPPHHTSSLLAPKPKNLFRTQNLFLSHTPSPPPSPPPIAVSFLFQSPSRTHNLFHFDCVIVAHLALPSCVVFSAAAHLGLPDYPVVGHGRSGPVHDCLQHQHPGIVHQARWEVGTD